MGLLDRLKRAASSTTGGTHVRPAEEAAPPRVSALPDRGDRAADELPLTPESTRPGDEDRARIKAGLAALEVEGVDVDDLTSLGEGLDRALSGWMTRHGEDHDGIVERYAIGIGEHLVRRTDLTWAVVTDVFGTDLAVSAGDFVVVPHNLVAVRWMRRETGWAPRVVGHLVDLRTRSR
ncbi:DUF3806 domain-containing protein [Ornithinimicrobium avium]|uniref:DUF3806 domain-containing protein n=1 Tax=Ornithinimicrobium avium TaxID=2283195 RepID=A0A345NPL7_9MICO|nr:DUF3806 domain-containing protein [Ornithinimicrobium avium]AXH96975.1 hypothetical protein DV701_13365 [Ornithinimicrobium avium]